LEPRSPAPRVRRHLATAGSIASKVTARDCAPDY
jgi:hypothetical protein